MERVNKQKDIQNYINDMDDADSEYESDSNINEDENENDPLVELIRDSVIAYVKESSMPICEYLTDEAISMFVEHTLEK